MILDKLLKYDAIQEAEDSIKDVEGLDEELRQNMILSLSLENHMVANELKKEMLTALGDSHMGISMTRYISILSQAGFKIVWYKPFLAEKYVEREVILFDYNRSILIHAESFAEDRLNSSTAYYNLVLKEGRKHFDGQCTSNGFYLKFPYLPPAHMCDRLYRRKIGADYIWPVWVGSIDAREGILYHLDQISKQFDFLPYWYERPHLWLVNYAETKAKQEEKRPNYDSIRVEKIQEFDPIVQEKIAGMKFKLPRYYQRGTYYYTRYDD